MLQRFLVDPRGTLAYLGLGLVACHSAPPALLPEPVPAATQAEVAGWVAATLPQEDALVRFTWLYQDEQSSKGGRGSARIARPDSLRFDIAGSLGIGKGSAMVVGDSAQWVVPANAVKDLVPEYPLLWAMFGVARGPAAGDVLGGLSGNGRTAWRYVGGADTVEYQRLAGDPVTFRAEVRRGGKVVGRSEMTVRADGTPVQAKLTVPAAPAKLEIKFYARVPTPAFPPEIWARPAEP
jgi:hypothetical protein